MPRKAGPGRPTLSVEINSRELCQKAIIAKFGDLEKGITYLLESGEPTLLKFAYEHAYGKPVERVAATDTDGNTLKQLTTEELAQRAALLASIIQK